MHYKAILFDLDDTLLDFSSSEDVALDRVYTRFFSHIDNKEVFKKSYRKINHSLWAKVEEGLLSPEHVKYERFEQLLYALKIENCVETISHYYMDSLGHAASWLPGAKESLQQLKDKVTIGIVTNGLTHVQEKRYQLCGLSQWCTCFLISEKVGLSKPDKKIFEMALQQVNAASHETLMVGDSLASDYQGALNAGLDFCWINPSSRSVNPSLPSPKYIVKSVAELTNAVLIAK